MPPLALWLILAWIPYTAFVLLYGFGFPWWVTPLGRSLLLSKTAIWLLLTHFLLRAWVGQYPGDEAMVPLLVAGVTIAGWTQLWFLSRTWAQVRRDEVARVPL